MKKYPLRHKFNAVRTNVDSFKFASKLEAKRYNELNLLKKDGVILFFLMQVPFHMPGGVKYVCDFLIFWTDGTVTVEDCKGRKTDLYIAKKKIIEATYPITITEYPLPHC